MSNGPWTDEENDLIVADYFAMLVDDLAGKRLNKAASYRQLADGMDRSAKAIEYKHQNISAVLKALGETWLSVSAGGAKAMSSCMGSEPPEFGLNNPFRLL
ncbi:hypothetical protein [Hoeflea sp.]|uniref:hypothetical protein n=1 Tax=Hoeflea sp. TaxID=1940281 RepID=UPI00199BA5DB|nr:hypothetical protein [Hoeflea sp.]MBC7285569.1 hypothetical protein [Hoeflea sp.]